jgi:hypothetical protein
VSTPTGRPLLAIGGPTADVSPGELSAFVRKLASDIVGSGARRVLLVPPDQTRLHSRAGEIVAQLVVLLESEVERVDVMPALGTHRPLGPDESRLMFGDAIDPARLLHHHWREDVTTIGELPADEVDEVVGRSLGLSLPFAVNRALVDESYDLVVSVGQVVPHEVAGFGGYTKHISIGLGGPETIQRSHFFSAVYGIEQTLGQIDAPVRQLLDCGFDRFLEQRCRVLFVLTVVEARHDGRVLRGVFAGEGGTRASGGDAFRAAMALSADVNIVTVALEAMAADPELAANLAAVAHLIHGSTEGRFTVTYAPGHELSRADIEGAGFHYLPINEALERFVPDGVDIADPGLGLWRI